MTNDVQFAGPDLSQPMTDNLAELMMSVRDGAMMSAVEEKQAPRYPGSNSCDEDRRLPWLMAV